MISVQKAVEIRQKAAVATIKRTIDREIKVASQQAGYSNSSSNPDNSIQITIHNSRIPFVARFRLVDILNAYQVAGWNVNETAAGHIIFTYKDTRGK